ncbi:MAG: hypothetical protein IPL81_02190 [Flavobacteriales bacterium]|jgi:hypothetical protein|nr:hypothetical protein [Flavobacteriales bacterium]MBK9058728.1 hypothetical protein [Flavobacteriales bacterium]QQS71276.1 MAG: hypothetical protein IPP95_08685 [Flavobacteriales bacterium]HQV39413.1 hypothetical protein [Flavobacteriales bacterium]HQW32895.1 hypothetical protein [Flavobacteriales bacterium]
MAHSTDPFTPSTPLSRELLERYAQGRLTDGERHAVELHLESDPLLREAVEGLQQPGAVAALGHLNAQRPAQGLNWKWGIVPVVLLIGAVVTFFTLQKHESTTPIRKSSVAVQDPNFAQTMPAAVESTLLVVHAEIDALPTKAVPEATGHQAASSVPERFHGPSSGGTRPERETIERIDAQPVTVARDPGVAAPREAQAPRPSRHLVFLHDLKVVHPEELYGTAGPRLRSPGVPANVDPSRPEVVPSARPTQPYLDFLDVALGALAKGNDRTALDDLYFLLGQYPDDVNAQFYAGLACYRLGLYPRGIRLLHAAASNSVDSFREESLWYEALATVRQDGKAARPALERIVSGGGFYAAQAKALLEAR